MRVATKATQDAVCVASKTLSETVRSNQRQAILAQSSLDASVTQFREGQRPYIGQTAKSTEPPAFFDNPRIAGSGQVTWDWHMTNYGKTPANNVSFTEEIKFAGQPFVPSYGFKKASIGPPQPPNGDIFGTVVSKPISKGEFDRLRTISGGIEIRIRIHYQGAEGIKYESGICLSRLNLGAIAYCAKDNYIK